jgi:protein-S-isoprenylcysteine O-methyltransferase Ste14
VTVAWGAALAAALFTFGGFVWAVQRFFVRDGAPAPGMRAIALGGTVAMVADLVALGLARGAGDAWHLAGAALFAGAALLFWAAVRANRARPLTLAFSDDRPGHLVTWGPYAWVRHPFYSAYMLAWIAGAVAAAQPLLLGALLGMGALYRAAARREEAKFAASDLADAYAAYRARTGMFLPRRLAQPPSVSSSSSAPSTVSSGA